jgi:hypothetical protein
LLLEPAWTSTGSDDLAIMMPREDPGEVEPMLVTFRTKAYADITMFGDVAKQLLTLLGHSGTIPSALSAEDVPAALARLEAALQERKAAEAAEAAPEPDDRDAPRRVTLSQRAVPLLELLRAAAARNAAVMWSS